ncbi:chorismate mutase [Streptomyces sp. NPDC058466]|uniref:chorismate mutase n=1 Tax=Streptomyces sp. NPDC058466 TaxID=3346512 RepID=UPI00365A2FAB
MAGDTATAEQALAKIVRLAGARVMTADTVAAAKWGTKQPIDDPAREMTVLDRATTQAAKLGIDPATVRRIVEDQITANKTVQRALYAKWREEPFEQPTYHPDLATQVRPALDHIDSQLLIAIQQAQPLLHSPSCSALLDKMKATTSQALGLDAVHRTGFDQALTHTCPSL